MQNVLYSLKHLYEFKLFLCLRDGIRGHLVFVLSATVSVCDSVAEKNNLGHNFWTVRDRGFIFGMHTQQMKLFQTTPRSMTLWPWQWPLYYKYAILDFVAAGGIRVSQTQPFY